MTIRRSIAAVIAVAVVPAALGAQAPALTFPEGSAARFESGSVIRVPRTRVISQVEVQLAGDDASGQPTLVLDDALLRAQRFVQSGHLILAAESREPRGVFPRDEHRLVSARIELVTKQLAEWRILRWKDDTPYTEASRATVAGSAPEVLIDEPKGGAFVHRAMPPRLAIKGRIVGPGDFALHIAGRDASGSTGADGTFAADVDWTPGVREIEVAVSNRRTGASRQVLLPIATVR